MRAIEEQKATETPAAPAHDQLVSYREADIPGPRPTIKSDEENPPSDWLGSSVNGYQPELGSGVRRITGLRVAIVHEWLETFAGSERVLEQLLLCFPNADLFAVVDFMSERERGFLRGRRVQTTLIQRLPFARRMFRR